MNRRAFLSLSAISPLAHLLPALGRERRPPREMNADVVIVGGGVGGIACALAAARNGLHVIVTEQYEWIGGQLTSQGVPPDEHPWIEERGCTRTYRGFRNRVRDYYRRNYPLVPAAQDVVQLNPGSGTVSKLCHEPRVAVAVLLEMLAPHLSSGRIRMLQKSALLDAEVANDRVRAVRVGVGFDEVVLSAPYFVDATELGDVLDATRTEFVTGAESFREHREPHGAEVNRPTHHQAFTCCFAMDYIDGEDHTIDKPRGYDTWKRYEPRLKPAWPGRLFSWEMSHPITLKPRDMGFDPTGPTAKERPNLWTYRRILAKSNVAGANDICCVNWPQNDYWLGNLFGVPREEAAFHLFRAQELSLSWLYWMQTEAPRAKGKPGWPGLRLRPDVMGTEHGLAQAPYIRESRRIVAEFTVTENHIGTDARAKKLGKAPGEFIAELFPDTVGIGSYRIDLHPSSGGDNYIDVSSLPFQIPLGALLPVRMENLLPACKNIGTTHITNGCYRLHPVEWNIGEAVGELIAFSMAKKTVPRQVRKNEALRKEFQDGLVKAGFELEWPENIAKMPR